MKNKIFISLATACSFSAGMMQPNAGWSNSLQEPVIDHLENKFIAIQDFLDQLPWQGLFVGEATSGPITLGHLMLNGHSKVIVANAGQKIEAEAQCAFDPEKSTFFGLYQVVVGLHGMGPQAVIGKDIGFNGGTTTESFTLCAPEKAGIYQICFRPVKMIYKTIPFSSWLDSEGVEPDASTTIGLIIVK